MVSNHRHAVPNSVAAANPRGSRFFIIAQILSFLLLASGIGLYAGDAYRKFTNPNQASQENAGIRAVFTDSARNSDNISTEIEIERSSKEFQADKTVSLVPNTNAKVDQADITAKPKAQTQQSEAHILINPDVVKDIIDKLPVTPVLTENFKEENIEYLGQNEDSDVINEMKLEASEVVEATPQVQIQDVPILPTPIYDQPIAVDPISYTIENVQENSIVHPDASSAFNDAVAENIQPLIQNIQQPIESIALQTAEVELIQQDITHQLNQEPQILDNEPKILIKQTNENGHQDNTASEHISQILTELSQVSIDESLQPIIQELQLEQQQNRPQPDVQSEESQPEIHPQILPDTPIENLPEVKQEVPSESQLIIQSELQPSFENNPESEPQIEPVIQPVVQPEIQSGGFLDAHQIQPNFPTEAQSEVQPEVQSDVQSEVQPDAQSEVQPDAQPEVQPEVQPDAQPEVQPAAQPDAQPEVIPENEAVVEPEILQEIQPGNLNNDEEVIQPELPSVTQLDIQVQSQPDPQTVIEPTLQSEIQQEIISESVQEEAQQVNLEITEQSVISNINSQSGNVPNAETQMPESGAVLPLEATLIDVISSNPIVNSPEAVQIQVEQA